MIRALFWKEWRQIRWILGFGCVILMGFTSIGLVSRVQPDLPLFLVTVFGGSVLMPILVGMNFTSAELKEGSLGELLSFPVESWKVFLVKFFVGCVVCVLPLIGAMFVGMVVTGGRELSYFGIFAAYFCGAGFALCLYVWIVVFGMMRRSGAQVGLVGVGVLSLWFLAMFFTEEMVQGSLGELEFSLYDILHLLNPLNFYSLGIDGNLGLFPELVLVQLFLSGILFCFSMWRFSRLTRRRI